jgi:hypothetical protein
VNQVVREAREFLILRDQQHLGLLGLRGAQGFLH